MWRHPAKERGLLIRIYGRKVCDEMALKKGGEVFSRLICGGSLPPKGGSREPWNRRKDFATFPNVISTCSILPHDI
jgi:hypothetical protein